MKKEDKSISEDKREPRIKEVRKTSRDMSTTVDSPLRGCPKFSKNYIAI